MSDRPRLLHITTVPMTLATFFVGQLRDMQAHGLEVEALSSPGELLEEFGRREGITVHALDMPRRIAWRHDLRALWRLWRLLRRLRPTIVHAHTPKAGLLGMIAAWLARTPVRIYHLHGLPLLTAKRHRWLLRTAERVACRLAHQVLCVSPSLREVALAERLCPPHKIKVLLRGTINGVDAGERFNPERLPAGTRCATRRRHGIPEDALVLGFVGRLVRDKGLVELTAAWAGLREQFDRLHLLVVGPVEDRDPVPPEVLAALQGDARVHLTGQDFDTPPLYAAMDVLALPTYREGFPNVPLEAAAMALPVVATTAVGCRDAVQDGKTGRLVPVGDRVALAAAVASYLADAALRQAHGRAGRAWVSADFCPSELWQATRAEYARLLAKRGVQLDL